MSAPLPHNEEELFSRAAELPITERAAYLDQACAGDTALRSRIEALPRANDDAAQVMATCQNRTFMVARAELERLQTLFP